MNKERIKWDLDKCKTYLNVINPNIEIMSKNYDSNKTKFDCLCKIDGYIWKASWLNLRNGYGCPVCGGKLKLTIEECNSRLNNENRNILITSQLYKNNTSSLNCECLVCEHEWISNWSKLKKGYGCPECARSQQHGVGRFNKKMAIAKKTEWITKSAHLYVIKCNNDEGEEFYKIGITTQKINKRFKSKKQMPYNYEILYQINTNLYMANILEEKYHKMFKIYSYCPKIKFGGYTECFSNIDLDFIAQEYIITTE